MSDTLTKEALLAAVTEVINAKPAKFGPLVVPPALVDHPLAIEYARMYGFDGVVASQPLPMESDDGRG